MWDWHSITLRQAQLERYKGSMSFRSLAPLTAALLLAACGTRPTPPVAQPPIPRPAEPVVQSRSLIGLSMQELGARFGRPSFQVREGPGLKLQWTTAACVLDVYLYRPQSGAGLERVTYVEARRPSGDATDQLGCITAIDAAG